VNGIAVKLYCQVDRLGSQPHDSPDAAAKRHDPSAAVCGSPVGRESGLPGDILTLRQVIVDEVMQQELIYWRKVVIACHRPDIVN
jgi:hypothetical protein